MNEVNQEFNKWVLEQDREEGNRNSTVVKIVREGLGQGLVQDELKKHLEQYCSLSGLNVSEAMQVLARHGRAHDLTPFVSNLKKSYDAEVLSWAEVVKDFLRKRYVKDDLYTLVIWNSNYYEYLDGSYKILPEQELESEFLIYLVGRTERVPKKDLSTTLKSIKEMLKAFILVPNGAEPPFLDPSLGTGRIERGSQHKKNWIVLENGVFDLKDYMNGLSNPLIPHTPHYFSLNKLPFPYIEHASCPTWLAFLKSSIGSEEVIDLIQEWFGYNLCDHARFEKFLIAYGKGRNGKSVMLKVLSLMLGYQNIRSIGLESFDPMRTYALADLVGAKANIVNDLNEFKKTGEGLLKQFVSGEPLTVERKYKDHFTFKPTAKITIATNHHVRWSDKSDGIWKRMILINFERQILDESKQDKRLVDDEWWERSGELPGVFLWALEGLKRLEKRQHFSLPRCVEREISISRNSSNAAAMFLNDYFEEAEEGAYPSHWLYRDYRRFCEENGFAAMQSNNFAMEVKRVFSNAKVSDDTHTIRDPKDRIHGNKAKTRVWLGIQSSDGVQVDWPTSFERELEDRNNLRVIAKE